MAVPPILAIKSTKKIRKIISFTLSNVVHRMVAAFDRRVVITPKVALEFPNHINAAAEYVQLGFTFGGL